MRRMIQLAAGSVCALVLLAAPAAAAGQGYQQGNHYGWGEGMNGLEQIGGQEHRPQYFYVYSPGRDEAHPTGTHRAYHVMYEGEWWA